MEEGDAFGHGFLLLGEKGSQTDGVGDEVEGRALLVLYKLSDGGGHSSSADGKKLAGFVGGDEDCVRVLGGIFEGASLFLVEVVLPLDVPAAIL